MALATTFAGDDFFSPFPFPFPGIGSLVSRGDGDRDVARGIPIDVKEVLLLSDMMCGTFFSRFRVCYTLGLLPVRRLH
jgi:hypothetical protein